MPNPPSSRAGAPAGLWSALADGAPADPVTLRAAVRGLPAVDEVGVAQRVATLWSRSIKNAAQRAALDAVVAMTDLTTLEGADTPGRVRTLTAKAARPDSADPTCPSAAAVCVYPDLVAAAKSALAELHAPQVAVAAVATAFPSGRSSLEVKLADTAFAVAEGADEIDMVIDRGAFLAGDLVTVFEQVRAVKAACGRAHLKVILETSELVTLDHVRQASWLAMAAGADFVKTSTGKASAGATGPVMLVMATAVRDFAELTGRVVGLKAAGGIRSAKDAVRYLVLVREVAGSTWLSPALLRFGASTLLNDVLMQRRHLATGSYPGPDYLAVG